MRPDDRPSRRPCRSRCALEVRDERLERLGHVAVAQVPGRDAARGTSRGSTPRRSRPGARSARRRRTVLVESPVAARELGGPLLQLDELLDDLLLARLGAAEAGLVAVDLGVVAEVVEAGVALAGALRRLGVDSLQVARRPPPSRRAGCRGRARRSRPCGAPAGSASLCSRSQLDEVEHVGVAPHPGGKRRKSASASSALVVVAGAAHVAVDAVRVGPVGLDRDGA